MARSAHAVAMLFALLISVESQAGLILTLTVLDKKNEGPNDKMDPQLKDPPFTDPRWANVKVVTRFGNNADGVEFLGITLKNVFKESLDPNGPLQDDIYALFDEEDIITGKQPVSDFVEFLPDNGTSDLEINFYSDPPDDVSPAGHWPAFSTDAAYGKNDEEAGGNNIPLPTLPAFVGTNATTQNSDLLKVVFVSDVEASVPEPTTITLLTMAGLGLVVARRFRKA